MAPDVPDTTPVGAASTALPAVPAMDTVIEQTLPMTSGELLSLDVRYGANVIVRGWDQPFAKVRASHKGPSWRQAHAIIGRTTDGVWISAVSGREGFVMMRNPTAGGYLYARVAGAGPEPMPVSVDHQIEVWIPRRSNVSVQSLLGGVVIENVEGTLGGVMKDGDIEFNNVRGTASISTAFGDIRVANSVLSGTAHTACGTVSTSDVSGGLRATSALGPPPSGQMQRIIIVDGAIVDEYCSPRARRMGGLPNRLQENNPYGDMNIDSAPNGGTLSTGRAGSITVRSSGGHISATTHTGNIELANVRGDATARSNGGNITIRLINTDGAEHHVYATTTNGTVTIELPDELDARVEVEATADTAGGLPGRRSDVIDRYGLSSTKLLGNNAWGVLRASQRGHWNVTRGRGTGLIYVRVRNGDVVFTRARQ
ncbi:MAG: hypothetical protein H7Z40_19795 [Phycisphaerae bacterium]|nr:hypothetical protein [Gemmatimonadaceae bacterium]